MATFENQDALPKLPLPELEATLKKYLLTVKPVLTEEEYNETERVVNSFKENEGPELHEDLKQYREKVANYVEEFWDSAYLDYNVPVVLNVNPIFVLEDDPTPSRNSQIARASSLVLSAAKFVRALRYSVLAPDVVRTTPLDMSQFRKLFSSARVPKYDENGCHAGDKVCTFTSARHIVVMCRGQFYYFDVVWPDGTIAITQREINRNLSRIMDDAEHKADCDIGKEAIGVLTTETRTAWAATRARLTNLSENNKKTLEMIDAALFVLCLDHSTTGDADEIAKNILHGSYALSEDGSSQTGSCINRWYDKLQIIVTKTGNAGVNFEHSAVDGHTVLRFASDVFTDTIIRFAQTISGPRVSSFISDSKLGCNGLKSHADAAALASNQRRPETRARKLEFDVDDRTLDEIGFAERKLSDLILQNETHCVEFVGYGGDFIKQSGMSPDAFVQVAILSAYYRMYGTLPNTYESVQTKAFLHGRTEAARSATKEALDFLKLWNKRGCDPAKKIEALRVALKTHSTMTREASRGMGVDRHLFAMKSLYQKNHPDAPLPAIFTDKAYSVLGANVLSTSNCGNPSLRFFGFGPVMPQGFGVGYIIRDTGISFCLTSKNRQTKRFGSFLKKYLGTVQDVLLQLDPPSVTPRMLEVARPHPDDQGYGFFGDSEQLENDPSRIGRSLSDAVPPK